MADPAVRDRPLSVEEYLQLEEEATVRHEYVAGEVYALAGVTPRHNRIAVNITAHLWAAARGGPCRVYASDVKLRAGSEAIYYPDVMVVCEAGGEDERMVHAPCLLVEVTSPSTIDIDRREKLAAYKRLASLRAYLVVHQDRRRVERFWRDADGAWWHADVVDAGRVPIPCPEVELTLAEIYEGTDVPAPGER